MKITIHLLALLTFSNATAQVPITPVWERVWPFGNPDPSPQWYWPDRDNYVVIDPATDLIHCTVNDDLQDQSQYGEFLFTFGPDGEELTPSTIPLAGPWASNPDHIHPMANNILDLSVESGKIFSARQYPVGIFDIKRMITGGPIGATQWIMTHGSANFYHVATFGNDVVAIAPWANDPFLFSVNKDGWFEWKTLLPLDIRGISAFNGIIYIFSNAEILRYDMSNGDSLPSLPGPSDSIIHDPQVNGTGLYWAVSQTDSAFLFEHRNLDGSQGWSRIVPDTLDLFFKGLAVGPLGEIYCALEYYESGVSTGYVYKVNASDPVQLYSYGCTINSLICDSDHLYLTGKEATGSSATFLAAFDLNLITAVPSTSTEHNEPFFWPNPTTGILNFSASGLHRSLQIHDVQGRSVTVIDDTSNEISVEHLDNGVYFITIYENNNRVIQRFILHD